MLQSFTLRQQLQTARQGNCYFILLYYETMDGKYGKKVARLLWPVISQNELGMNCR